ncbi:MAG: hypothetical protein ACE5IH_10015 [Thermodesulfobacteriota bacterium]
MPSPNEVIILRIAREEGDINKQVISSKMEVTTDYADFMLRSLCRKNYLAKRCKHYGITPKGAEALLGKLLEIQGRLTGRFRWEQWLKERTDKKIAELEGFLEKELLKERVEKVAGGN